MVADATETCAPRTFELKSEAELRFEIPSDCTTATITLTRGSAEIFGVELALNRTYTLAAQKSSAAFTWHGASLTLKVPPDALAYVAGETPPMASYLVAHAALQDRRNLAARTGQPGPRAMVVGARDAGKTALVRTLAAYCVKANGNALVGDLDGSAFGAVSLIPETVGLSIVSHLDLEDGTGAGAGGLVHERVSSYMMGHAQGRENLPVTRAVLEAVTHAVDRVGKVNDNLAHVGALFDTCGDDGPEGVVAAALALRADVVFVLGAERLCASVQQQLQAACSSSKVETEVVLLQKSGGVVSRDNPTRAALLSRQIRAYFYGTDNKLSPFRVVVEFANVTVLKVGGQAQKVPDSLLAIGAESTLDPLKPVAVKFTKDLLHSVLAISQAEREEDVLKMPVFGYVHVVQIDMDKASATVLAPSPGKLPGSFLLIGNTKWIE